MVANGAAIVWLWYNGGNVSGVHSTGQLLTSLGRITGLLGAYLALFQVLLLARLPFLEHLTGFDRLTVWHRRNGKLCLYLVLAHVVLTTIGYALTDRISIPSEASTLLSSYPGMIAATVGTGLFIVVVISSLVIARRQLRYEAWYLVHLSAYAAIALAWFHQIPTGNELVTNPAAANYWISLYLATLVILLLFRVLQPIVHAFLYRLQVSEVRVEGPNVVSLHLSGHHLNRLRARPGQFFLWRFLTWNRWWESHPFSLSAVPDGQSLRITVKNVGDFTGHIGELAPGTRVIAEGPFGMFTNAMRRRPRVALIAGGIGITPIRALLEEMSGHEPIPSEGRERDLAIHRIVLIYRVISDDDLIFRGELERLARDRGIRLWYVVGDHRVPGNEDLLSPQHLRRLVPDIAERDVYLCGPPAMANSIENNVRHAGVPRTYIHTERFAL